MEHMYELCIVLNATISGKIDIREKKSKNPKSQFRIEPVRGKKIALNHECYAYECLCLYEWLCS